MTEDNSPNAKSTGSWSSRGSHRGTSAPHHHGSPPGRSASYSSHYSNGQQPPRPPSRHSVSQASIPISALISPHVASVGRVGSYHMRDPRKPSPVHNTPWSLSFPSHVDPEESRWAWRGWVERGGSPLHAWLFFIGFIIFPIWWLAALFIPVPRTRHLPADAEKGVMLDDPQVEHGGCHFISSSGSYLRCNCTIRCKIVAEAMSRYGWRVSRHLCALHRPGRYLCLITFLSLSLFALSLRHWLPQNFKCIWFSPASRLFLNLHPHPLTSHPDFLP